MTPRIPFYCNNLNVKKPLFFPLQNKNLKNSAKCKKKNSMRLNYVEASFSYKTTVIKTTGT